MRSSAIVGAAYLAFGACSELEVVYVSFDREEASVEWEGGVASQLEISECVDDFCPCTNDGVPQPGVDLRPVWSIYSYDVGIEPPVVYGDAAGADVATEPEELVPGVQYVIQVTRNGEFIGCRNFDY
jgi:hypothetical protein